MNNKTKIIYLLSLVLITGCAISTHYIHEGGQKYPAISPDQVKIYTSNKIDARYEVIGSIAADNVGDGEAAMEALKKEAASIGANAVIDVKLTKIASTVSRTGLSGVAIRVLEE